MSNPQKPPEKDVIRKKTSETSRIGSNFSRSKQEEISAIFGYILISIAILSFIALIVQQEFGRSGQFIAVEIPILFFIAMLGFAFIHQDLLKDQSKSLSTMRIVVFMMINVICMLMLKMGWNTDTFHGTGLDGYWVTIIGFVFGGKVAQSYIENRFAETNGSQSAATKAEGDTAGDATVPGDQSAADVAKMAADQHRAQLQSDHANINSVSDSVAYKDGNLTSVVVIYLSDSNTAGIPLTLDAQLTGGGTASVPTEIITNVGKPRIQQLQQDKITGTGMNELGSIGAMVTSTINKNFRGVLTSGHIYSDGTSQSKGRVLMDGERTNVQIAGVEAGVWHFQMIDDVQNQDLAIAQLNPDFKPSNFTSFKNGGYYQVNHKDVLQTKVILNSAMRKQRNGFILDYNVPQDLPYDDDVTKQFTNVILIGSSNDRENSHPVSEDGDSGGSVYVNDGTGDKLIGLILGSDQKYTFVLPVQDTLSSFHFNLL